MHRNDETAARADRNFNLPSLFQYPEQKTIELIFYLTRAPATAELAAGGGAGVLRQVYGYTSRNPLPAPSLI